MLNRLVVAIAAVLFVALPAASYEISAPASTSTYDVELRYSASDGTGEIDMGYLTPRACSAGRAALATGSTGTVEIHGTKDRNTTTGASTLVATVNGSEGIAGTIFSNTARYFRFKITVSGTGTVQVKCSNLASIGGSSVSTVLAAALIGTGSSSTIYRVTDQSATNDCDSTGGGSTVAWCGWSGSAYVPIGVSTAGLTNPLVADLNASSFKLTNVDRIDLKDGAGSYGLKKSGTKIFVDKDGNGTQLLTGEREPAALAYNDDIWIDEFNTGGSTTFGLQEAINHVCSNDGTLGHGAQIRVRGDRFIFGSSAQVTVPCRGVTIAGVSPDRSNEGVNTGTEFVSDQSTAHQFFVIDAADVTVQGIQFVAKTPVAGAELIRVTSNGANANIRDVWTGGADVNLSPTHYTVGIGIHVVDPHRIVLDHIMTENLDTGVQLSGVQGPGGGVLMNSRISCSDSSHVLDATCVGLRIGITSSKFPFTNFSVRETTFESNNIGIKMDTVASSGNIPKLIIQGGHFENALGVNPEEIRATGANSVVLIGSYGGNIGIPAPLFHRTSQTASSATDIFYGPQAYGSIVMDAGKCEIYGVSDLGSGVSLTPCRKATNIYNNGALISPGASIDDGSTINVIYVLNGQGTGIDSISFEINYGYGTTGNVAMLAKECRFSNVGTSGGGLTCEDAIANSFEHLHLFPPTADSADTTDFIALAAAAVTDAIGASTTSTLTNKTFDADASGSSNLLTTSEKLWFVAAGCNNATASPMMDMPASNAPSSACLTGTNIQKGVLDFDAATQQFAQLTHLLPGDWTGALDVKIKWLAAATSGSVVWKVETICVADAETDDPSFNAGSTVTDAAKGTANQTNDATIASVTTTGCAVGELLHLRVSRDAANGSDDMAGNARLIGVEMTQRRSI